MVTLATVWATLCAVRPSVADDAFPRGDGNCSYLLSAPDVVASLRAFNGEAPCQNDDCDRDGTFTAADVDCTARCLFGECAVPPSAPTITAISPDTGADIAPFSTISIAGNNFDSDQRLTQVTIGGIPAEVVDILSPQEILVIVPPLPPGPAQVRVQSGDVAGLPSPIEIAPQSPVGDPDTIDGTFVLMSTVAERFAALDLASAFGDDASVVRDALQVLRDNIATQRAALAADPAFTAELRAQLDASIDSSGVPEALRDVLADIDALSATTSQPPAQTSGAAVQLVQIAQKFRKTVAVARAALAAGTAVAAETAAVPVELVAIGIAAVAGTLALAGSAALPPIITSQTFTDSAGAVASGFRTENGHVVIRGARLIGSNLVIRSNGREIVLEPEASGDDTRQFQLYPTWGFCGTAEFFLKRTPVGESQHLVWHVLPDLISLYDTTMIDSGEQLNLNTAGVAGCDAQVRFTPPTGGLLDFTTTKPTAENSRNVFVTVPAVKTDDYKVTVVVNNAESNPPLPLHINNVITGVAVECGTNFLKEPPADPSSTTCTAKLLPGKAQMPAGSQFIWELSDGGTASIDGGGATVTVKATHPGMTDVKCSLKLTGEVLAQSDPPATVKVVDATEPSVFLDTVAEGQIPPGATIPVTVRAGDNEVVSRIVLHANGEAVLNGEQEFPCAELETSCDFRTTVNIKSEGFNDNTVTLVAEAYDGAGNKATDTRTYTVEKPIDSDCPVVTISSPPNGGTVNAGMMTQVVAHADDSRDTDTGVKRFHYTATGEVLTAPVTGDLRLPMPLPSSDLRFAFTVKMASELTNVQDHTVVVSVQASDDAGNTCPAATSVVSVIGLLDQCSGSITVDKASGYIDDPFTITVTITGDTANEITSVISTNPGGNFDLAPHGDGTYTVTLFYQGQGAFTLQFSALDAEGNERCSGSIGLEALGPKPEGASPSSSAQESHGH